jgi:hypothetical protein
MTERMSGGKKRGQANFNAERARLGKPSGKEVSSYSDFYPTIRSIWKESLINEKSILDNLSKQKRKLNKKGYVSKSFLCAYTLSKEINSQVNLAINTFSSSIKSESRFRLYFDLKRGANLALNEIKDSKEGISNSEEAMILLESNIAEKIENNTDLIKNKFQSKEYVLLGVKLALDLYKEVYQISAPLYPNQPQNQS